MANGPMYAALLAGTLFAAAGQVAFKLGATGRGSLPEFLNLWIAGGLVLYGLSTMLWIFALSRLSLTIVYPFTALTFVLVFCAGVYWLGESATAKQFLGVGLVLLGLFFITTG
jgi:undecaprenyl phosphate-alpha-L-ara4N flippase subunit ArnE